MISFLEINSKQEQVTELLFLFIQILNMLILVLTEYLVRVKNVNLFQYSSKLARTVVLYLVPLHFLFLYFQFLTLPIMITITFME